MKRGTYKKIVKSCAYCGAQFEGTARAKYCSRSHSVLAVRKQSGRSAPWEEVDNLKVDLMLLMVAINSPDRMSVENRKVVSVLTDKYQPLLLNETFKGKMVERLRVILKL